jgi:hypothetical protein
MPSLHFGIARILSAVRCPVRAKQHQFLGFPQSHPCSTSGQFAPRAEDETRRGQHLSVRH